MSTSTNNNYKEGQGPGSGPDELSGKQINEYNVWDIEIIYVRMYNTLYYYENDYVPVSPHCLLCRCFLISAMYLKFSVRAPL